MLKPDVLIKQYNFRYLHLREDPTARLHFATVSFPTGSGQRDHIEVPASVLGRRSELKRLLLDRDAKLPSGASTRNALLDALGQAQPGQRQRYAAAAGWSPEKEWFVIGRKVIGKSPVGQLGVRPSADAAGEPARLRQRGTAKGWYDSVAKLAAFSSISMLTICAAMASPLLAVVHQSPFGICLCGRTRSGKTLSCKCAASMIGIGPDDDLIGWLATGTSLEERLAEFRDQVFIVDDVSLIDASESERHNRLTTFAYMLSSGQGKGRARIYRQATSTRHTQHRSIMLTSAEEPLSSLAARLGRNRQGGEAVRLIDLPVLGSNQIDIFDRIPDPKPGQQALDHDELFRKLIRGCRRYRGAAFEGYVSGLIGRRLGLRREVRALVGRFVKHAAGEINSPESQDLARKFGLLFAGGVIGVRLKCVPWQTSDVLDAITTCYKRARNLLNDDGQLQRTGLATLSRKLAKLPKHEAARARRFRFDDVDGYQEARSGKTWFIVKHDVFNRWFSNARQRTLVQRFLLDRGVMLSVRARGTNGSLESRPSYQCQWPDGRRRRSLQICWPLTQ